MHRIFLVALMYLFQVGEVAATIPPNDPRWQSDYEDGMHIYSVCNPGVATFQPKLSAKCNRIRDAALSTQRKVDRICGKKGCPDQVTWQDPFYEEYSLALTKRQLKIATLELNLLNSTLAEPTPQVQSSIAALAKAVSDLEANVAFVEGPAGSALKGLSDAMHFGKASSVLDSMNLEEGQLKSLFEEMAARNAKGEAISVADIMRERGLSKSPEKKEKQKQKIKKRAQAATEEL